MLLAFELSQDYTVFALKPVGKFSGREPTFLLAEEQKCVAAGPARCSGTSRNGLGTDTRSGRAGCPLGRDRKSTRLNSSHEWISYAVFCLKKKKRILCRVSFILKNSYHKK